MQRLERYERRAFSKRKRALRDLAGICPSKQRSRMTNGTALLPDIDGRSAIARRFKDITSGILADQGGADQCSESRLQLVRRFAAAAVLAEQMESRLANGEQIDIQEHALLCSTLTRLGRRFRPRSGRISRAVPYGR